MKFTKKINSLDSDNIETEIVQYLNNIDSNKYLLIINLYDEKYSKRLNEYIRCLEANISFSNISKIIIIYDTSTGRNDVFIENYIKNPKIDFVYVEGRVTYQYIFDFCNENYAGQNIIMSNSDIIFDRLFFTKLNKINLKEKFICLTRYNICDEYDEHLNDRTIYYHNDYGKIKIQDNFGNSVDTWIFQAPLPYDFACDIQLGTYLCDSILNNQLLKSEQVTALNLSKDLITIHIDQNLSPNKYDVIKVDGITYEKAEWLKVVKAKYGTWSGIDYKDINVALDREISLVVSLYDCTDFIQTFINNINECDIKDKLTLFLFSIDDSHKHTIDEYIEEIDEAVEVYYFKLGINIKLYDIWNIGFKICYTSYVGNFNVDDMLNPSFLSHCISVFDNEKIGLISSKNIYTEKIYDNYNSWKAATDYDTSIKKTKKYGFTELISHADENYKKYNYGFLSKNNFPGCSPVFRRILTDKYGYVDEDSYNFCADYELWLRFSLNSEFCFIDGLETVFYQNTAGGYSHKTKHEEEEFKRFSSFKSKNLTYHDFYNTKILSYYKKYFLGDSADRLNIFKKISILGDHFTRNNDSRKSYKLDQTKIKDRTVYFLDKYWQEPVSTEKTVFKNIIKEPYVPGNYLAFPWATLIDDINVNANHHLKSSCELLGYFADFIIENGITVCQHIHFRELLPLFKKIGIKYLFASHCTTHDKFLEPIFDIKILPFPLFPIHKKTPQIKKANLKRQDLSYSFIGAYDERYYLSDIRERIFEISPTEDKFVVRRENWHFFNDVYGDASKKSIANAKKKSEKEYTNIIERSKYSLCPSGSGHNTIRFWESLSFGSVPILFSDDVLLPEFVNWNEIIIYPFEINIYSLDDLISITAEEYLIRSTKCIEIFNSYFDDSKLHKTIYEYFKNPDLLKLNRKKEYRAELLIKYLKPQTIAKVPWAFSEKYPIYFEGSNVYLGNLEKYYDILDLFPNEIHITGLCDNNFENYHYNVFIQNMIELNPVYHLDKITICTEDASLPITNPVCNVKYDKNSSSLRSKMKLMTRSEIEVIISLRSSKTNEDDACCASVWGGNDGLFKKSWNEICGVLKKIRNKFFL